MSRLRIRSSYLSSAAGFVLGLPSGLKRDGRLFFLSLFQHFLSAVPFFLSRRVVARCCARLIGDSITGFLADRVGEACRPSMLSDIQAARLVSIS